MALERDTSLLQKVEFFSTFNEEQLRLLAFGARNTRLEAGRELFYEGQKANGAYIIIEGDIELMKSEGADLVSVARLGPGEILTEAALLTATAHAHSAYVRTDCQIMMISRDVFRKVLEEYPGLAVELHRKLRDKMLAMVNRVTALESKFSE